MHNDQYSEFEAVFLPLARGKLAELAAELVNDVANGFAPIEVLDQDVQRGLSITEWDPAADPSFIDLILTDGDEYGFEGVGLVLNCSVFASGQVWAPGNYTEDVGTLDKEELARRLLSLPVSQVADQIRQEWARVRDARDSHADASRQGARG